MKKVGILTLYEGNYNYGGNLQAYALCKYINELGHDCKVIAYEDNYNPIYPSLKEQLKQYKKIEIIKKMTEKISSKITSKEFKSIYNERIKLINDFKEKYIPHTTHFNDERLLTEYNQFDILISGSDQVWNPNCSRRGFLQLFPHENIRKVSYAASISRGALSEKEKNIMIPAIRDFDFIGVREKTAKEILKQSIDKDISVTADPTLLLNKSQWSELASEKLINEKYVLCYFFSNSKNYREKIQKLCEKQKLKLIYIPYAKQEYNKFDNKGEGTQIKNVSPQDFLSLFKNATYIFTDSFHGAVFSLIFEKKFLVFERDRDTKVSMNSRLYDLLERTDLKDRLVKENINLQQKINEEIDYCKVNKKIEEYKNQSIEFLKRIFM